jgi:hypothetical protein
MPTQDEIEAAARVLCRMAYFQLPANETCVSPNTTRLYGPRRTSGGRRFSMRQEWLLKPPNM